MFVDRMINVDLDIDRGLFVDRMINDKDRLQILIKRICL